MTIEDIVALTKAGFSKDEILALTGDPEQEKKPADPEQEKKPEYPKPDLIIFQDSKGLKVTGTCDAQIWDYLIKE